MSEAVLQFLRLGAGGAVLGIVLGWVVGRLGQQIETSGELLLFVLVHIFLAWTVSQALGLSLPLAALIMGSAAASLTSSDTAQRIFVAVRGIEQPLYLLFFALAGASIHLDAIGSLGLLGAAYIVARVAGKLVGGFAGGWAGGLPWRRAARLGFDLTPQAGVAVGLAVLTAEVIPIPGADVAAVVLSSVVVFELLGPLIVARGLSRFVEAPQEAGALRVSSGLPTQVLIASPNRLQAPSWLLDLCSRGGAGLTALGPGDGNDEDTEKLRSDAGGANVSFKWVPLTSESFAGAVVRTASLSGADLVVVLTPIQAMRDWSRLVLHPHERIARQLTCPVIFLPYGTPDPEVAGVK